MDRRRIAHRSLAAAEVLLVFPAALFVTALFVRNLQPLQFEPAHSAERIVAWYAARPHLGLWVLMILLPVLAMVTGTSALVRSWRSNHELRQTVRNTLENLRAHLATFVILLATALAGGILAIVAVHLIAG